MYDANLKNTRKSPQEQLFLGKTTYELNIGGGIRDIIQKCHAYAHVDEFGFILCMCMVILNNVSDGPSHYKQQTNKIVHV